VEDTGAILDRLQMASRGSVPSLLLLLSPLLGRLSQAFHRILLIIRTELVGLAATETPNPRQSMPAAVKGTFWRITIIYITSLIIIGLAVPYTDDRLGGSGAGASPFVIVMDRARIPVFNHIVNATICISVLSIVSYSLTSHDLKLII
jgi:amino acid permease